MIHTIFSAPVKFLSKGLILSLVLCLSVAAATPSAPTTLQPLKGHVPAVVGRLKPLHRLAATNQLRLVIGVPARQPEQLKIFLDQIYDPASSNYHEYLTPAEFTAAFGPTAEDYETVIQFAQTNHFKILSRSSSRLILEVEGPVAEVERAFHVTLQVYQHPNEAREFYAPDAEPSIDPGLPILDLGGLNNYVLPRPRLRRPAPGSVSKSGSGPNNLGYSGYDFRAAYAPGITNTGAGQSVGLVEFDNYYPHDIYLYETNAHLPTNTVLTNVFLNGFGGTPGEGNVEVALDIEMAITMAPGLSRVIVYAESYPGTAASANTLLSQMANDNLAKQLSCSWVVPMNATSDTILQQCAAQGQSFFDASGDDGSYIGDIPPPSDDPYLTQVGGTELTTANAGGPWASEIVWNQASPEGSSSGGVSHIYAIPSWQQGVNFSGTLGSPYQRNFPDVAMVATNVFNVSSNGLLTTVGGTSCAAPLWAGFAALVNQQAVLTGKPYLGLINSAVYRIAQSAYAANFHDITVGNNTDPLALDEFFAQPGYDLCTGWGSPTGSNLFNALLASPDPLQLSPLATLYLAGPVGGPFNISSQTFTLTNTSATLLNWTNAKTATWLTVSSGGGTLASHGFVSNVTVGLNGVANSLTAGVYNATVWFTNLTTQTAQSRNFSLSVGQPVVLNGGFETGGIADWVMANDIGTNDFADDGYYTGLSPHTGSDFYFMAAEGPALASLTQTVMTYAGQPYILSFWLENHDFGSGTSPNQLTISWNGTNLFNQANVATISSYTNFQFEVLSTGLINMLQFATYNYYGGFLLDDVTLTPVPLPQFLTARESKGVFTATWSAVSGQKYQVQYTTNLAPANWINLAPAFTATSTNISTTNAITGISQRFYRIALIP